MYKVQGDANVCFFFVVWVGISVSFSSMKNDVQYKGERWKESRLYFNWEAGIVGLLGGI